MRCDTIKKLKDKWKLIYTISLILFLTLVITFTVLITFFAHDQLNWQGWIVLYIFLGTLALVISDVIDISLLFFGIMIVLILLQIIPLETALKGFSNEGVATIAILFVVAESIQQSGLMNLLIRHVLRNPHTVEIALFRMLLCVSVLSAFTNNTPIVAILIPTLEYWSIQTEIHLTYLLMPLSFAAILGGTCTLIGTSTNIIVLALIKEKDPTFTLNIFEIGIVGWPITIVGCIYMIFLAKHLLPSETFKRSYINRVMEIYGSNVLINTNNHVSGVIYYKVYEKNPTRGVSIEEMFEETRIVIDNTNKYSINYVYLIAGVKECIEGVAKKYQLKRLCNDDFKNMLNNGEITPNTYGNESNDLNESPSKTLFEVKLKSNITKDEFLNTYRGTILKLNRNGKTIYDQDTDLKIGDVLLIENRYEFYKYGEEFEVMNEVKISEYKQQKGWVKIVKILMLITFIIAMLVITSLDIISLFTAASVVALYSVVSGILKWKEALLSIHAKIILLIACSFSLAEAIDLVGLATLLGEGFIAIFSNSHPFGILCGIYLIANILSAVVSNAATAVLLFPMVWSITMQNSVLSVKTTMYTLMIASSVSLITPIGYQTNLMVQKAGGYKAIHYLKFGFSLSVVCMFIVCGILYGYN